MVQTCTVHGAGVHSAGCRARGAQVHNAEVHDERCRVCGAELRNAEVRVQAVQCRLQRSVGAEVLAVRCKVQKCRTQRCRGARRAVQGAGCTVQRWVGAWCRGTWCTAAAVPSSALALTPCPRWGGLALAGARAPAWPRWAFLSAAKHGGRDGAAASPELPAQLRRWVRLPTPWAEAHAGQEGGVGPSQAWGK